MSRLQSALTNVAVRFSIALLSCFLSYKIFVAALSEYIPGQPFYSYTLAHWFFWLFDIGDLIYVTAMTTLFCLVGFVLIKKFTTAQLIVWGMFVGAYIASLFAPFDYLSSLDAALERLLPYGGSGFTDIVIAIFGLILFVVIIPLALIWIIGSLNKWSRSH